MKKIQRFIKLKKTNLSIYGPPSQKFWRWKLAMRCGILAMEVGDEMWNSGDGSWRWDMFFWRWWFWRWQKFGDEISAMWVEMISAMCLEMTLAMTKKLWRWRLAMTTNTFGDDGWGCKMFRMQTLLLHCFLFSEKELHSVSSSTCWRYCLQRAGPKLTSSFLFIFSTTLFLSFFFPSNPKRFLFKEGQNLTGEKLNYLHPISFQDFLFTEKFELEQDCFGFVGTGTFHEIILRLEFNTFLLFRMILWKTSKHKHITHTTWVRQVHLNSLAGLVRSTQTQQSNKRAILIQYIRIPQLSCFVWRPLRLGMTPSQFGDDSIAVWRWR